MLYDDAIIDTPQLVVPHPRMAFRRFVLEPAAEVASDMVVPDSGRSVAHLLEHLNTALPYVALLGMPGSGKTDLARRLAAVTGGQLIADRPPDDARANAQSTSAVPAGLEYQRQIQFLASRAELLDQSERRDPDKLAFSDFYFDQCLAYAELALDAREMIAYRAAQRAAAAQVVLPKLLVVLDTRPVAVAAGRQSASLGERLLAACRAERGAARVVRGQRRCRATIC